MTIYTEKLAKLQKWQEGLVGLSELTTRRDELISELRCRGSYELLLEVCELLRRSSPWRIWGHTEKPDKFPWYKLQNPNRQEWEEPEPWPSPQLPILHFWELDRNNVDSHRLHFITDSAGELYFVPSTGKLTKLPESEEELITLLRGSNQPRTGRKSGFAW